MSDDIRGSVDDPSVRPLALGYVREDRWMSEEELAKATCVLAEFADREGYTLGTVYIERVERTPAAFEALIASAIRDKPTVIVVPGFEHLQLIGSAQELADHVAKTTGARILSADPAPATQPAMPHRPPGRHQCASCDRQRVAVERAPVRAGPGHRRDRCQWGRSDRRGREVV